MHRSLVSKDWIKKTQVVCRTRSVYFVKENRPTRAGSEPTHGTVCVDSNRLRFSTDRTRSGTNLDRITLDQRVTVVGQNPTTKVDRDVPRLTDDLIDCNRIRDAVNYKVFDIDITTRGCREGSRRALALDSKLDPPRVSGQCDSLGTEYPGLVPANNISTNRSNRGSCSGSPEGK